MILVQINTVSTAQNLLQSASILALQLRKPLGVLVSPQMGENGKYLNQIKVYDYQLYLDDEELTLAQRCEKLEASFLFLQISDDKTRTVRNHLLNCRELRIPYVFYKDSFSEMHLNKIVLPVGFLEEELEKAYFASAFGRFCNSQICMLLANDYGSKAESNAKKMQTLFQKFALSYTSDKGRKDSFGVEMEAVGYAEECDADLIIVSASRDYGLDDLIFGPKELKIVQKSPVPILLLNPRGDLYSLCD